MELRDLLTLLEQYRRSHEQRIDVIMIQTMLVSTIYLHHGLIDPRKQISQAN